MKCTACKSTGIWNYGPNLEIDPTGADITCDCEICDGTGDPEKGNNTCVKCSKNKTCPFAYDGYNTNGDCLASK